MLSGFVEMKSDNFSTIDTRSRSDQVRDRILALIREGHVKAGEQLPTQRELARRYGVGMSSVREATQSLIGQGALEAHHGKGVIVRQLSIGDATRLMLGAVEWTPEEALRLLEARSMIEVNAARLAAARHTPEDLKHMAQAIDRSRECILQDDIEDLILADLEFHSSMVGAAHNEVVSIMLESISSLLRRDRFESYSHGEGPAGLVVAHKNILAAIAARNPAEAAKQVGMHLELARQLVRRRPTKEQVASAEPGR